MSTTVPAAAGPAVAAEPGAGLPVAPASTARVRAPLPGAADRSGPSDGSGLSDVAYRTVATPVGELLLAATDRGLVRVAFAEQDRDAVLEELARRVSPRVLHAPARLERAVRELEEYFTGHRREFGLPLDLRLAAGFRRTVLDRLRDVGYGTTATYGTVARAAGSAGAVRAVGTACARNPLPVVVPCHRVVRTDGGLGGYIGGLGAKRTLLALEAAPRATVGR